MSKEFENAPVMCLGCSDAMRVEAAAAQLRPRQQQPAQDWSRYGNRLRTQCDNLGQDAELVGDARLRGAGAAAAAASGAQNHTSMAAGVVT